MAKNFKILLITFALSFPFWWGSNVLGQNLEDFFFWKEFAQNPEILSAQANQEAFEENLRALKPVKEKNSQDPKIEAKSAISVFINNRGEEKILFEKGTSQILPIASLTKLMTANIVLENYDLSQKIKISEEAVAQEEDFGKLEVGALLSAEYLLYPLLIESSNDAAYALANDYNGMEKNDFIELMNLEAQKLNLKDTYFINPTGLDPDEDDPDQRMNYSTAADLAEFTKVLLGQPLIWGILSAPKFDSYGPELINTNKFLAEPVAEIWWKERIIGGKTGYTEKAFGCFLLVLKAPKGSGYLVNLILGTENRFGEMEKLVNWVHKSYNW